MRHEKWEKKWESKGARRSLASPSLLVATPAMNPDEEGAAVEVMLARFVSGVMAQRQMLRCTHDAARFGFVFDSVSLENPVACRGKLPHQPADCLGGATML
jgi:hypothetical protein